MPGPTVGVVAGGLLKLVQWATPAGMEETELRLVSLDHPPHTQEAGVEEGTLELHSGAAEVEEIRGELELPIPAAVEVALHPQSDQAPAALVS